MVSASVLRPTDPVLWAMERHTVTKSRHAPPPTAERRTALGRIRAVIARVPKGKVATYGQVAEIAGFPGGARLAVRALKGGTGLPWHRVVASGGRISLPGEDGREQRLRLEIEGVTFRAGRVRMYLHGWAPRPPRRRPGS